jgi:hypothetical protein
VTKVVTYSSRVECVNICKPCEARLLAENSWPRDNAGQEMVDVDWGLHDGACDICEQKERT